MASIVNLFLFRVNLFFLKLKQLLYIFGLIFSIIWGNILV